MKKTGLIEVIGNEDMEKKIIMLGVMNPQGYELDNRVYSRGGGITHTESRKRKDNSSEEV